MPRSACLKSTAVLIALIMVSVTGCSAPEQPSAVTQATPVVSAPTLPATAQPAASPVTAAVPSPVTTTIPLSANTTIATTVPGPTPASISEAALNARIVDSRNRLEMFMDSDVSDTVIEHPSGVQNCEVKKSRELGFLIDITTGESTFVKGDYWSIDANLFTGSMKKDRRYIIIHTHPRMWVTCQGYGVTSLYSFSIGDLEATGNLTGQGYHVEKLIAISDKDYRTWPYRTDGWKSEDEIHQAIRRIEAQTGRTFTYYDPVLEHEFYDSDNLMPLLVKELEYHYTINNDILA